MSTVLERTEKVAAIYALIPGLSHQLARIRSAGITPTAIQLPSSLAPAEGDDWPSSDVEAQLLGLPVEWANRVGVVVAA